VVCREVGFGGGNVKACLVAEAADSAVPRKSDAWLYRSLVISATSLAIAYFGFEQVSTMVASYRNSVAEADLARNIDRELIAHRAAARYMRGSRVKKFFGDQHFFLSVSRVAQASAVLH
jgi:secreted trypsin-like serine protease